MEIIWGIKCIFTVKFLLQSFQLYVHYLFIQYIVLLHISIFMFKQYLQLFWILTQAYSASSIIFFLKTLLLYQLSVVKLYAKTFRQGHKMFIWNQRWVKMLCPNERDGDLQWAWGFMGFNVIKMLQCNSLMKFYVIVNAQWIETVYKLICTNVLFQIEIVICKIDIASLK